MESFLPLISPWLLINDYESLSEGKYAIDGMIEASKLIVSYQSSSSPINIDYII